MGGTIKAKAFEPEIVVLYCEHSKPTGGTTLSAEKSAEGFKLRTVMLPCSSKIEPQHLLKIIEGGVDGVELVGCPEGRCKFLVGNRRAEKRVNYTRRLLEDIDMGAERIGMIRPEKFTTDQLLETAKKRVEAVRELGPNPMKGVKGANGK